MIYLERINVATIAALKHLAASVLVAALCGWLVFLVWYPFPFSEFTVGRELFFILISVDVVCGPILTFLVFDKRKPRSQLWRDIGIVIILQITALCYGLYITILARPVYLAFEGD